VVTPGIVLDLRIGQFPISDARRHRRTPIFRAVDPTLSYAASPRPIIFSGSKTGRNAFFRIFSGPRIQQHRFLALIISKK
jgi:hypothetical protein